MFATRRLAKRSILGTRVCAPWTDGRFYCGKIQATQTWPNGEDVYTIQFDDGYSKTFRDREIVGPGFQNVSSMSLKRGQRVFVTLNGREIEGRVIRHDVDDCEVLIEVIGDPSDSLQILRRIEDIRLMESRKSARLQDQGDQDYSRLADTHVDSKKRAVSHVIDVPAPAIKHRRRKVSHSPSPEPVFPCNDANDYKMEDDGPDSPDIMDERTAAMVLTSLSCSPQSPVFPTYFSDKDRIAGSSPSAAVLSSVGSSGVWGMQSGSSTPSPPQNLSQSVPTTRVFKIPPDDEGICLDDTGDYFSGDFNPRKKRAATRTAFKCTWPGCGKLYNTCPAIESHVRTEHLNEPEERDDSDNSDHEEEFYYAEVEVTLDTVTDTFADMRTSSSPHDSVMIEALSNHPDMAMSLPDHDYQKKSVPMSIPTSRELDCEPAKETSFASSFPTVSSNQISKSLSWQSPQVNNGMKTTKSADRLSALSGSKPHLLSTSPKNSPAHRKTRGDIKKCRKVYGMENKDMWCTQCKWKKACSRFLD